MHYYLTVSLGAAGTSTRDFVRQLSLFFKAMGCPVAIDAVRIVGNQRPCIFVSLGNVIWLFTRGVEEAWRTVSIVASSTEREANFCFLEIGSLEPASSASLLSKPFHPKIPSSSFLPCSTSRYLLKAFCFAAMHALRLTQWSRFRVLRITVAQRTECLCWVLASDSASSLCVTSSSIKSFHSSGHSPNHVTIQVLKFSSPPFQMVRDTQDSMRPSARSARCFEVWRTASTHAMSYGVQHRRHWDKDHEIRTRRVKVRGPVAGYPAGWCWRSRLG